MHAGIDPMLSLMMALMITPGTCLKRENSMDLINAPDDPTICIMCKHYYCTFFQLTCKPQDESLEQFEQRVTEAHENAEWY